MIFTETPLKGAYLISPEPSIDKRGLFARTYCEKEFKARGLQTYFPQCNTSYNTKKGTLRGMHYQQAPYEEVKLVRCTAGEVFDVIVDLRHDSSTYLTWHSAILSAENRKAFYIPKGCAHGFLTLDDGVELHYMMGEEYHADLACGVRWDDPALKIQWPTLKEPFNVNHKDQQWEML
ncbi:MAG: dTDP-4-dehydrorhamnose 3,5-epimerase [Elusimicrobia bacterium RIFOXYB2_FULL_49_7]|nr:MAG: dTDP-4-dehydrorhamnose 3,5-epimerase [Elusimicrobia bacterium RIFOXYB2_FULL_49_7]